MCRSAACSGGCVGGLAKAFMLTGSIASASATPLRGRALSTVRGVGTGHDATALSEVYAESHHRRMQNGHTAFDTSCDAGPNCKTMAACDSANGYPMTESMDVFNTICLNNVYWAERAFSGLYDQRGYLTGETVGYYKCACCGLPLYSSNHAYDAHSGWPAYFDTIDGRAQTDDSEAVLHNPANGELVCKRCGLHLGHRFTDGPQPTGLRDCIDSACLSFVPGSAYPQSPVPASEQVSVYFGAGCFWHTQYDMFLVESDPGGPFARSGVTITSHVGYAGGWATGTDGLVCYHSDMAGTLYSDLGHAEAVEVRLDPASQVEQFNMLLEKYFDEFQLEPRSGKYSRLDPQDRGPAYRAIIGIPGGQDGDLYPLLVEYNRAHLNIDLVPGRGHGDTSDEYKIYVYDTVSFPFYRGEQYHQFHENTVLGRYVPGSYTGALKATQAAAGLIDSTGCPDQLLDLSSQTGPPPPPDPAWPAWRVQAAADGAWRIAGTFTGVLGGDPVAPSRPQPLGEYCDRLDDRCYQESGCTLKCMIDHQTDYAKCQCSNENEDVPLVDITVSIPASCNVRDQDACGIVTYTQQGGSAVCEGRLTYLRRATLGPPTVYTFTERITSGDCLAHLTIDVAATSGGLGYRNSDGRTALLAVAGPPPATEDLMVSSDSCEASMATFANRITTECCTVQHPCRNGIPTECDANCGRMWAPFASRCGDYINHLRPELAALTAMCGAGSVPGGGH